MKRIYCWIFGHRLSYQKHLSKRATLHRCSCCGRLYAHFKGYYTLPYDDDMKQFYSDFPWV